MSTNDSSNLIDVDLTRSTSGVWLVKMPKYSSQILNEYGDGAVNGEIERISDGVLPTVYTRTLTSSDAPLSEQISVVDKVIQQAEIPPVENEQYMSMKRRDFEVSKEPTGKAQKISEVKNNYAPKRNHEANKEREEKKKLMGKRTRSPEDVVIRLIFEAFSEHQYISMSSLQTITKQPKTFLQQLVKRFCNYNSAGRTYELKSHNRYYEGQKKRR